MRQSKLKQLILALVLALPGQYAAADFIVDVYNDMGPFTHIDDAINAMNVATPTNSDTFDVINFSEGGVFGNFGGDSLFSGAPTDLFGVHVYGLISIVDGYNYFGINHDDGALLGLRGFFDIIDAPAPTPPINSFGWVSCGGCGSGESFMVDLWLYENYGVTSLEFFHSDAENGVGRLVSSVPEPGTLALLGIGLFGMGMARRRKAV